MEKMSFVVEDVCHVLNNAFPSQPVFQWIALYEAGLRLSGGLTESQRLDKLSKMFESYVASPVREAESFNERHGAER